MDDVDSILMAQRLSRELGLGVGISSGANLLGAIQKADQLEDGVMVTVFADDNKKYLSTDYTKQWEMQDGYMSKDIELVGFASFR